MLGDALKTLDEIGGRYLQPGVDGALLTGDSFLIHALWKVQYRITDPVEYVTHLYGDQIGDEREKAVVRAALENALIGAFAEEKAEDIIVGGPRLDAAIKRVQEQTQKRLDSLDSGWTVTWFPYS